MHELISDCSQASWLGMTGSPIGKQRGQSDGFKCVEMITQAPASTCDADWRKAQLRYSLGCECTLQLQLCQGTKEHQRSVTTSLHVCGQTCNKCLAALLDNAGLQVALGLKHAVLTCKDT